MVIRDEITQSLEELFDYNESSQEQINSLQKEQNQTAYQMANALIEKVAERAIAADFRDITPKGYKGIVYMRSQAGQTPEFLQLRAEYAREPIQLIERKKLAGLESFLEEDSSLRRNNILPLKALSMGALSGYLASFFSQYFDLSKLQIDGAANYYVGFIFGLGVTAAYLAFPNKKRNPRESFLDKRKGDRQFANQEALERLKLISPES